MDPHQQQLNQLDPKLKEAYEKVMGAGNQPANNPLLPNTPSVSATEPTISPSINSTQTPAPAPQASIGGFVPPVQPGSVPPPPIPPPPPSTPSGISFQPKPIATPINNNPLTAHGFVAKKKNTVSPVIVVIGTIVFLVVYTLFWMKFFNIKTPFLP